ncbi:ABC transporter permease [Blastococcus sp. URHD0036]|uniref:ABC transporter permease n=1 Tax=Blastococcus sp. URHD0036 TaxID=1380356 RepID=UPI000497A30D|nr:ABC transporter permease [Blastococcus sp. URHD0036]
MHAVAMWLRLDLRRRRRSLLVLALLIAFASGTVFAAAAGARRGESAIERIAARTLPLDLVLLPNQPGFDWDAVRAMPEVEAVSEFVVGNFAIAEIADPSAGDVLESSPVGFATLGDDAARTVEAPVVLEGRMFDPARDEVVVTANFADSYGYGVGDTLTGALPSPEQTEELAAGGNIDDVDALAGPRIPLTIVGVVRSLWYSDTTGSPGSILPSPHVYQTCPDCFLGSEGSGYVNALVRLTDGPAGIPAFQAALAELTGRTDIEVFNGPQLEADGQRRNAFEADNLYAFALAALLAAVFLVGQTVARYTAAAVTEMRTLAAVGMTPRQSVQAAVGPPLLAAVAGTTLGVGLAVVASRWFPVGSAALVEPDPGTSADWLVLGVGWVAVPLLVAAGAAGSAFVARRAARLGTAPRSSAIAAATARMGWPVPVVVGTRFALEPGRGRSAIPVRPALIGSVIGVLGVVAAFTFASGVSEAAGNPARFGQTFSALAFIGFNDEELADPQQLVDVARADPSVTGVVDARSAVADIGDSRATLYSYDGAGGPPVDMVLSDGRPPEAATEIVLGPDVVDTLGIGVGDRIEVVGTEGARELTLVGIGFTPEGPHNSYSNGGWVSGNGYTSLFADRFKFSFLYVATDAGPDDAAAIGTLNQAATDAGIGPVFGPPFTPQQVADIGQVTALPRFLAGFLALLAMGAIGHALATAVRRRRHDIAVLRALGMTRRQSRWVVVVQATVLALVGLALGVPLGVALGRVLWQVVADYTPLQYSPPIALLALAVIGPAALLVANLLAAWPGRAAARLRIGAVLRAE